jgi:hypothetical protein
LIAGNGSQAFHHLDPSACSGTERQEFDMGDILDWNAKTIAEFRANEGRVGGTEGVRWSGHTAAAKAGSTSTR